MSSIILNTFNYKPDGCIITSSKTVPSNKYATVRALSPICQINGVYVGGSSSASNSGSVVSGSYSSSLLFTTKSTTYFFGVSTISGVLGGDAHFTSKNISGQSTATDIIRTFNVSGFDSFGLIIPSGTSVYLSTGNGSGSTYSFNVNMIQSSTEHIVIKEGDSISNGSFIYNEYTRYL